MSPSMAEEAAVRIVVAGRTDTGRRRTENQDSLLIADLSGAGVQGAHSLNGDAPPEPTAGSLRLGAKGAFLLVADGMGGAAAGAVASSMAVAHVHQELVTGWGGEGGESPERFALRLRQALESANARIFESSQLEPGYRGMGTTATLAGLLGDCVYLAQVGDSRAYLIRDGVAVQVTRDQSVVQELVDAGTMTEEEAERSPQSNRILQALGAAPAVVPAITWQRVRRGDVLLLCSDGLTAVVRRDEIAAAVQRTADQAALCQELIDLANERGGPDNITVVAARFDGEALSEPGPDDVVTRTIFELPAVA